jgi:hypothetical protein
MKKAINFFRKHDEFTFTLCFVLLIATIGGAIYGYKSHIETKARNQAIARAKQMDGKIYSISEVAWNWVGDTELTLKNERGETTGSIMMYMANPFDAKINPLSLAFTHPHDPIPVPMKVKVHFRETPWAAKYDGKVKDSFTGSYLEFEIL